MRSRLALNLVLGLAVLGLGWLVLRPAPRAPDPGVPVTAVDTGAVRRIRVQAVGQPPVTLTRDGDRWRLQSPIEAPADAFRVAALLGLPRARSEDSFPASGGDLAQYGLSPAKARLQFDDSLLELGDTDPVAGRRYVLAGGRVHLIEDRWFSQVFGEPEAWVDPRPLAGGTARPTRMTLPGVEWRLLDGHWKRTPPDDAVSADAGQALADAWARARALSVRALDPALPWDQELVLEVEGRDAPLRLGLARTDGAALLARPDLGVQYRFLPRQMEVLLGEAPP